MALRLAEHWLWDFWFATDGDDVHVFYLKAPRALGDPDRRHHHATIGHAVSNDLRTWAVLPDALEPGDPGAFDDLATWTGSVMRDGTGWRLFYTGVSRAEGGRVQRIGSATSADLVSWRKLPMVLEADPRWYAASGVEAEWRDPWVDRDESDGRFHMLVTACATSGPADSRGVIGHLASRDLCTWEAGPPLSEPGEFSKLEVPQLVHLGGAWRILFCTEVDCHGAARLRRPGAVAECGTHYLTGDARYGRYTLEPGPFMAGDPAGRHYAGRLLEHRGAWHFLAWKLLDGAGRFVGELADPAAVSVAGDGRLMVHSPS
jgi:beta-fructofuranosidase